MPKARLVIKVEKDESAVDGNNVIVTVRDDERMEGRVSLTALNGAELMRAGANVRAGDMRKLDTAARIEAIKRVVLADDYRPTPFVPRRQGNGSPDIILPDVPKGEYVPNPDLDNERGGPAPDGEGESDDTPGEPVPGEGEPRDGEGESDGESDADETPGDGEGESDESGLLVAVFTPQGIAPMDAAEVVKVGMDALGGIPAPAPDGPAPLDIDAVRDVVNQAIDESDRAKSVVIVLGDREPRAIDGFTHSVYPEVLRIIGAGIKHVWLSGPAGTGKSTIAEQVADALSLEFHPFSTGPADMPSRLLGFKDMNGEYHSTPIRDAYEHGGVLLIDEIDNANAGCLTTLNMLLANKLFCFPDGHKVAKHSDMYVVGAANTWGTGPDREYVGRSQLDAATLNRFPTKVEVDYDKRLDTAVAMQWCRDDAKRSLLASWVKYCQHVRKNASDLRVPVIVSPRNISDGAALLAADFTPERVVQLDLYHGMASDLREKLDPGVSSIVA